MSLETFVTEYQEAKKKFIEQVREEIGKEFKRIFTENPRLKCISWTQYTPYFNDGDPCIFRKNDFSFSSFVPEETYYDEVEEGGFYEDCISEYYIKHNEMPLGINWMNLVEFDKVCSSSEIVEVFHELFGDHAWIKATIDGFDVEDYDHD